MSKYRFLFLLFCFAWNLSAQQTLSGTVVDAQTGETLIGANVFLRSDFTVGTQTDLDGNFSMKIPEGDQSILITYIGFQEKTVIASNGKMNIQLEPTVQQTVTIEVRAEKAVSREFAANEIGKLDIYLNPNSKADPLLAVDAMPASTNVEETANISLRGSAPYETGVFLNNVPIDDAVRLDQSNGVGQFSIFNTAMIENLQVFPSNPPVEFGNATSGVVALNTDEQGSRDITSIVATVVGGGLYLGREISPQTSLTLYGNYFSHHGLVGLNPSSLGDIRQLSALDAGLYMVHRFSEKTLLKFFNYSLAEGFEYAVRAPSYSGNFEQGKKRNQSIINLIQKLPNGQLDFNQGINFSKGNYTLGNIDLTNRDFDYFASLNWRRDFPKGSLKTGASWMARRNATEGQVPLYEFAYSPEHMSFPIQSEAWSQVPEMYIYGKKQVSEKWLVGAGARWHFPLFDLEAYLGGQANVFTNPMKNNALFFPSENTISSSPRMAKYPK